MEISNIKDFIINNDYDNLKKTLSLSGIDEQKFDDILEEVSAETIELERSYKKESDIFPEHDFKVLAFKNVLSDLSDSDVEAVENIDTEGTIKSETTSINSTSLENSSSTNINNPSTLKNEESTSSSAVSGIPSSSHLSKYSQYDTLISEMSIKYNVPFDLIKLVINAESTFDKNALSKSGAVGLMQLMPATAKWLGVSNSYDPAQNVEGGTKYLRYLLDKYDNNATLAVAAYNAGPGNVDKYKGIPPFSETQNYVKKILG